jgi:polysaccharide biosynthesis/export protein
MKFNLILCYCCFILLTANQACSAQITLQGAFNQPGVHQFDQGAKLSKLLEQAGGLKDEAYPFGAIFLRKKLKTSNDDLGRMVVETDPAVITLYTERDTLLKDGDYLFIPYRMNTVAVLGAVLNPTTLPFVTGQRAETYIQQSGGLTKQAGSLYIMLPNGIIEQTNVASWNYKPTLIPPGSLIYAAPNEAFNHTAIFNNAIRRFISG